MRLLVIGAVAVACSGSPATEVAKPETAPAPSPVVDAGASAGAATTPDAAPTRPTSTAGSLRLEGQVVDDSDSPIAGATVSVTSVPPRTATSEADGSFFFDGLAAGSYVVSARKDSLRSGEVRTSLTEASDPVIVRVRP